MRSLGNENGVALLLVLAITALLAALLSQLSFSTLVDLRLTETYRDTTRAHYLAKGGIQVGQRILTNDSNSYDGDDELWAQGVANYPVGDFGAVSLTIIALDGKININSLISTAGQIDVVVMDRCLRLFDLLEISDGPSRVDAIIDWIDADDDPQPSGAESGYYAIQTPATYCKNGPFDTLDELAMVAGFTTKEINTLRKHISVYGDNKLHINSATAEVIAALAEEVSLSTAQMIVEQRQSSPYQTVEELKQLPNMESFYWAINSFLTVRCNTYRITTDARVGDGRRQASATVNKETNNLLYFQLFN
ncbi:MAG: hypothetical protein BA874_01865 [Desulfuromonadales bacterium C00003068]|jgi:general secretion pathway protein K|nr:MAG: hypothetical protein BA874_01865 [Desulfuromonadales bacterium C00003068]